MKWVDYREKLGIGFNDKQKFKMLSAMLKNYVDNVIEENYDESSVNAVFILYVFAVQKM